MGASSSSSAPLPYQWFATTSIVGHTPFHLVTTAASHRICDLLRHHLKIGIHLQSSFKQLSHLCHLPRLKTLWCDRNFQFHGINVLQLTNDAFGSAYSSPLCFFDGGETKKNSVSKGRSQSGTSRRNFFNGRQWTNVLLAINVLVYIAQVASQGKLMFWGAKINGLIDRGQFWRLATSSLLHANLGHLMVNCYSLNNIGPTVEQIGGSKRFIAVYLTSAITSSAMSYLFCKSPAVGASGAIFGLVGSVAVFVMRHRGMIRGSKEELGHIAQVIFLNMVIGVLYKGIDNWGHLGGLLGGAATSWLVGPAWKYESTALDGRKIYVDRAPISFLKRKGGR